MKRRHLILLLAAVVPALPASVRAGEEGLPDSLHFGRVRAGTAAEDTVQVWNRDASDLLIESAEVPGPVYTLPGTPFSGSPVRLGPGEALDLPVRFTPPDTGRFSAQLAFQTDRGVLGTALDGEGVREVVVINEILADPPAGDAGDANGDGKRNSSEDEFVELLNTGLRPVRLDSLQLSDAGASERSRFTFPTGTWIGPGERVVLFGGGTPTGFSGQVFVDDGRIGGGLRNSGDALYLIDPAGPDTLARAAYGPEGGQNQSLVRDPEGTGPFVAHGAFPGNGAPFSPGRPRIRLAELFLDPPDTSIDLGATVVFAASGRFTDGEVRPLGEEVTWASSDASVLALAGSVGRAVGIGTVSVSAEAGGMASAAARVQVKAPGFVRLALAPPETLALVGDRVTFSAEGVYADSTREAVSGGVAWTSSDSGVAVPDGGGAFTARGPGQAVVRAQAEGVLGTAILRAGEVGDLNADGVLDLLDALEVVQAILKGARTRFIAHAGDLNTDGKLDILDLALLVARILGGPPESAKIAPPVVAAWKVRGMVLEITVPAGLRAMFLEVGGNPKRVTGTPEGAVIRGVHAAEDTFRVVVLVTSGSGLSGALKLAFEGGPDSRPLDVREIQGVDVRGRPVRMEEARPFPEGCSLAPNFPNPFNGETAITFSLSGRRRVLLRVFSCTGQEVVRLVDGPVPAGVHRVLWDGRDEKGRAAASGVYLASIEAEGFRATIRMVLLR